MGIVNLMQFLKKKCPHLLKPHTPAFYKGKRLAIDAPSTIYKFLIKTMSMEILYGFSKYSTKFEYSNGFCREPNWAFNWNNVQNSAMYGSKDNSNLCVRWTSSEIKTR